MDDEIARAQRGANELISRGNSDFSMTGDAHPGGRHYPVTENWQKTIGGHQTWSSADVKVEGDRVTMKVTVHGEDYYNFNHGQADIASGAKDDENGRFTELGWAKPFKSHGEVTRTVTWTLGDEHHDQDDTGDGPSATRAGRTARMSVAVAIPTGRRGRTTTERRVTTVAAEVGRAVVVAVAAAALASGCGTGDAHDPVRRTDGASMGTQSPAAKSGTGEERHDLAPLTKRFEALGDPTSATWFSGTLGSDDAPGPASYWIDAVVVLPPQRTATLASTYAATPAASRPDVVAALRSAVPTGSLLRSDALDEAFSTSGFASQVWLERAGNRLVLSSKGQ